MSIVLNSSGGGSTTTGLAIEVPSGSVNGSNTSFTVSNTPIFIVTEQGDRPVCVARFSGGRMEMFLDDLWKSGHKVLNILRIVSPRPR